MSHQRAEWQLHSVPIRSPRSQDQRSRRLSSPDMRPSSAGPSSKRRVSKNPGLFPVTPASGVIAVPESLTLCDTPAPPLPFLFPQAWLVILSISALLKYTRGFSLPPGLCVIRVLFWNADPALAARFAQRDPTHGRASSYRVPDTEPVARTRQKTHSRFLLCKSQSLQSSRETSDIVTRANAELRLWLCEGRCVGPRAACSGAGFPEEGTDEQRLTSTQAITRGEQEELSRHGEEQRPLGRRKRGKEPRLEHGGSGALPEITIKPGQGGDFSPDLRIPWLFS